MFSVSVTVLVTAAAASFAVAVTAAATAFFFMVMAMAAAATAFFAMMMTMASAAASGVDSCAHDNQFAIDFINDQVIQSVSGFIGDYQVNLVKRFRGIVFVKSG